MEQAVIFIFGALGYSAIEILWRGYTHWTMALAGGICAVLIYMLADNFPHIPLAVKCIIGALIITGVEFFTGLAVNIGLKWNVWDYSSHPFNVMGQICILYSTLWFVLCIPVIKLFEYFQRQM